MNGGIAVGILLGALTGLCAVDLPSRVWIVSAFGFVGSVGIASFVRRQRSPQRNSGRRRAGFAAAMAWLLGFAQVSWVVGDWLAARVAPQDDGARWIVRGEVASVPSLRARDASLDAVVRIIAPRDRADEPPRRLRIRWFDARELPAVGEQWEWLVEVRAHPTASAVVDVERLWLRDRVHGAARVMPGEINRRIKRAPSSIDSWREHIAIELSRHVADRDALALIRALSVGLTDQMTRDQWRVFSATGTTHLVAISGMHVTLFAWLAFALARAMWRYAPIVARRCDREPFALVMGLSAAAGYAALAGMSVPTQRTLMMLGAFAVMRIGARVTSMWHSFSIALLLVLLGDPLAPLGAGFWLSFGAVGAILWAVGTRMRPTSAAGAAFEVQFVVLLALTPLTVASFGSVSLASLVANAVAIPVISFVLVPMVLVGALASVLAPGIAAMTLGLAERVYAVGWPWLSSAADWSYATWVADPEPIWYAVGALGAFVSITPAAWQLRLTGALAMLPLLLVPAPAILPGHARIELFDTGRGVLATIATAHHTILYDTGDSFGTDGRYVENIVQPWLARSRRTRIDVVFLPRVTQDRAVGVGHLLATTSVASVRGGGGWPGALVPYRHCQDGERWILDGVVFEQWVGHDGGKSFCGVRVGVGRHRVLLASDFNHAAEREWLARDRSSEAGATTWAVLVPRRGAATASSEAWVEALQPRIAVVTGVSAAGPAATQLRTIARWQAAGAHVYQTVHGGRFEIAIESGMATFASRKSANAYPFLWKSDP